MSKLDTIIPPEISDDEFYYLIRKLAAESHINTILEIGSSAGGGSTEAFVSGLRDNPYHPHLFCMEISRPRFAELQQRYASEPSVHCYNVSSVPVSQFPSEKEVELFYRWVPSVLNHFPLERVIGWLRQDIDYVGSSEGSQDGIQKIKREQNIATFDMVLIDGSEFTGMAELEEVYGAEYILLDDINSFKNRSNYRRLQEDPAYSLLQENWTIRNGYAVFRRKPSELPVHFFTIVLNGEPFVRHHIEVFNKLPFRWHWHIIEGVADLKHDTAWSLRTGGKIPKEFHNNGLSNDGTSEYLDWLANNFSENVTVYRKPGGVFWDGKLEMVMSPLPNITEECLLWQIDVDELWSSEQLITGRAMFHANPSKTSAFYTCTFFVGPWLVTANRGCYGNHTGFEWLRTWRYCPEDVWLTHEPPRLCRKNEKSEWVDVARLNPFVNAETERTGLIFQHFAYATESQLRFKELYYGYAGATDRWFALQTASGFPVKLSEYFPWVHDDTLVDRAETHGVEPIFTLDLKGGSKDVVSDVRRILIIRTDTIGDNILFMPALPHLRKRYPEAKITVCCQDAVSDLYSVSPCVDTVIPFNHFRAYADEKYREQIMESLRAVNADLAINAAYTRQLLNEYFTLGCGAGEKIAFDGDLCELSRETRDADNPLYSKLINSPGENKAELERNRDLLAGLGIATPELEPQMWTAPEDAGFAERFFIEQRLEPAKTIALFVTGRHEGKQYPRYPDALGRICREYGYSVVAFGASQDRDVSAQALGVTGVRTINLCGDLSLRQSAEIIRRCRCAVGADTGLSHIACAVGTPHVVILWGGHFGRFFPYSPLTTIVCLPLECYGCNWKCPYPHWHCVKDIDSRVIEFAVSETLDRRSTKSLVVCQHAELWDKPARGPGWMSCVAWLEDMKVDILSPDESDFQAVVDKKL